MGSPCIHMRKDESEHVETCLPPFFQSGRLVAMSGDWITMRAGRVTALFFVPDFVDLLGGEDSARRIFRNAIEHEDFVEFRVTKTRLAYRNDAQYGRLIRDYPASAV
jgi:hypothetical protein